MYTTAELFSVATQTPKEIFILSVALSIEDDAEKLRLAHIWDMAHMSVRQLVDAAGMTQTSFAKLAGIPLRTVQDWCGGRRSCPVYVRFLLAEHYKLF